MKTFLLGFGMIVALLLLASGCAGGRRSSPSGLGDGGAGGGSFSDGGTIACSLSLVAPEETSVGQPVEMLVEVTGTAFGERIFSWSVDTGGVLQAITEVSDPVDRIIFTPQIAGPYTILVDAVIGVETCRSASTTISVIASGARFVDYEMRVTPLGNAPAQSFPVRIHGGSDAVIPTSVLKSGTLSSGQILDSAGAGVAAYVRARQINTMPPVDYETFSDAGGMFSLLLPDANFDLLVLPSDGALPETRWPSLGAEEIGGTLHLADPVSLHGFVYDAAGNGVAAAHVSLLVDGTRSTIATTGADGGFSVLAIGGALSGIAVAPPQSLGLPSLRSDDLSGQSVDSLSNILIRYTDFSILARVNVRTVSGEPAAGARVEWRANISSAATVQVVDSEVVSGVLRVQASADGTGMAEHWVTRRNADFVAQSSDGLEARVLVDAPWGTVPEVDASLYPLVPLSVEVALPLGTVGPVALIAKPLGILAPESMVVSADSDQAGSATLGLIRGGSYEIRASHPSGGMVFSPELVATPAGAPLALSLPGTLEARGRVSLGLQDATGAQVRLYCSDCSGPEIRRVHASAVVDSSGNFVFRVADPGVMAQ